MHEFSSTHSLTNWDIVNIIMELESQWVGYARVYFCQHGRCFSTLFFHLCIFLNFPRKMFHVLRHASRIWFLATLILATCFNCIIPNCIWNHSVCKLSSVGKIFKRSNEWRLQSNNVRIRIKFLLLTSWCQRWIYRHYLLVSRAHSTSYFWLANRRISVHNRRYRSLFRVMTRRCCWVWST